MKHDTEASYQESGETYCESTAFYDCTGYFKRDRIQYQWPVIDQCGVWQDAMAAQGMHEENEYTALLGIVQRYSTIRSPTFRLPVASAIAASAMMPSLVAASSEQEAANRYIIRLNFSAVLHMVVATSKRSRIYCAWQNRFWILFSLQKITGLQP